MPLAWQIEHRAEVEITVAGTVPAVLYACPPASVGTREVQAEVS